MSYVKKCLSLMLSLVMMFSMTTVSMAAGNNPTSMSVPVTASIDNYYIVSVPASAGLTLSQEYNDVYSTSLDTGATFYGNLLVGVKGIIATDKELDINFGAVTLRADETNTAVLKYSVDQDNGLSETELGVTDTITETEGLEALIQGIRDAGRTIDLEDTFNTTVRLTYDRTSHATLANNSGWTYDNIILRTDLPYTGTYTGSIGITFGLSEKK